MESPNCKVSERISLNYHLFHRAKAANDLRHLILDISRAAKYVSYEIQTSESDLAGGTNTSGEEQLKLDVFNSGHLIYKHLAVCYLFFGNKTEAQRALEKSLDLKSDYFETHYLLGSLLIKENDLKSADLEFSIVLEKVPEHIGALANRAVVAIRQSHFDAARKYLIQLSGLDMKDHELYNVLGELCTRIKEFRLAINFYENYLQRNPQRIDVLNNISSCYAQLGNYQAAILGYQSVLEMEPVNELARENLVALGRHLQNHSSPDLKEAILFASPSYKMAARIA